ncbi:MAG TPA: hypothetical protein DDW49_08855 [Deltaproteobacteria bacterium]|nr:MAG: hypothetical protein A2048_00320 [Deltaproteobacteria bacterium GWA2_45_12]HBF13472.1 hypothetical protein [Deltaproteobacteria bacterium]
MLVRTIRISGENTNLKKENKMKKTLFTFSGVIGLILSLHAAGIDPVAVRAVINPRQSPVYFVVDKVAGKSFQDAAGTWCWIDADPDHYNDILSNLKCNAGDIQVSDLHFYSSKGQSCWASAIPVWENGNWKDVHDIPEDFDADNFPRRDPRARPDMLKAIITCANPVEALR